MSCKKYNISNISLLTAILCIFIIVFLLGGILIFLTIRQLTSNAELLSAIVGGLIGGGLTVLGSLLGSYLIYYLQAIRDENNTQNNVKAMLQGVATEINVIWDIYNSCVGAFIESYSDGYLTPIQPIDIYCPIYEKNALVIGKLNNVDLRKKIILSYTNIKAIIEYVKTNNKLYDEFKQGSAQNILIDSAKKLKNMHEKLKSTIEDLRKSLGER